MIALTPELRTLSDFRCDLAFASLAADVQLPPLLSGAGAPEGRHNALEIS